MKRWMKALVAASILSVSGLGAVSSGVATASNGTVNCMNGSTVVGMWVQVSGGTSGWAARSGSGSAQNWSFNTQGKSYRVHVGCGGTPQAWASNVKSVYSATASRSFTCWPPGAYGGGTAAVYNTCQG